MPKGQQTVKIKPLHGLYRSPVVDVPCKGAKPGRIQGRNRHGVKERQIAEAVVELVVADRKLGVDILFLGEPRDAGLFVAELVDELEPDGLMAGEDAPVGDRLQFLVVEVTAALHQAFEPGVRILDQRFDGRARLRRRRLEAVRRRLERRGLDRFHLDADLAQKIADIRILKQHTPIEPTIEVCLAIM